MSLKILFLNRKNCKYSKKILDYLIKSNNKIFSFKSNGINHKPPNFLIKRKYDYIFSFRSFYILKKNLLKKTKIASINFHPGPPEYRGIGCINFSLYNNEKTYGITTHLINEKIDYGKIIDVKRFKINKSDNLEKLLNKTHQILFTRALFIIKKIIKSKKKPQILKTKIRERWSKKRYTKKDMLNLYRVKSNMSHQEIKKIKRCTVYKKFRPYFLIKSKKNYI